MKPFLLSCLLLSMFVSSKGQHATKESTPDWTAEKRKAYLQNRTDSTSWDMEMMNIDKQLIGLDMFGPFEYGVFPVPTYELISGESNVGVGNMPGEFVCGGKKVYMNSFYVGKNPVNAKAIGERGDEVFFQIIVLLDSAEADYNGAILSRNHPDYLGQGFVKTGIANIEYTAFITAERNSFAIVNARLFDLKYGKTILIAPQSDRTLRSYQVGSPDLSSEKIKPYTEELLAKQEVIQFFQ